MDLSTTAETCPWYWGSHGCDRPAGHDGVHRCGTDTLDDNGCSEYNEQTQQCRYVVADSYEGDRQTGYNHEWSEWMDQPHAFQFTN